MVSEAESAAAGSWSRDVYQALKDQGISVVGFVPDGGMKEVIDLCLADPDMRTIPLTNESEGPGLLAGCWLGGAKGCLIMQSTGVGNVINNASMSEVCQFPFLALVSWRSSWAEGNRWQVPMGQRCRDYFKMAGFQAMTVDSADDAGASVAAAAEEAFNTLNGVGVFFSQRVMGVKRFLR
ncbi:thiamine pyrophosphate-binding protein [Parapusillimonas granuli]|uniref:Phosphonopyruvate decarboxylase n=1 Tax=Parapusillimonas granuli TaxID=380911 RepID=A0A853FZ96_9BURK|nr:thiamine pyrophosphate-binding protein [Parapusillimonas granuli]MBB5216998.1 sulfopyruvate decarboxylase alpha subunit [Parapusillimonas granuli]MEB2400672.1 thiamine pyrophosphate-binding protein [Alcaligenaceae bacterium]NYT50238.1 phosphonopyruvate decarboxylase [Parapusillimonas granuli]